MGYLSKISNTDIKILQKQEYIKMSIIEVSVIKYQSIVPSYDNLRKGKEDKPRYEHRIEFAIQYPNGKLKAYKLIRNKDKKMENYYKIYKEVLIYLKKECKILTGINKIDIKRD